MKKNLIFLTLATALAAPVLAQSITVPQPVTRAFKLKFPAATDIKWGKENAKEFEAEFKLKGIPVSANFEGDGRWTETETTISKIDLPAPVTNAIKTKYPAAMISSLAEKVEKPGKLYYKVAIIINSKRNMVELAPSGQFL